MTNKQWVKVPDNSVRCNYKCGKKRCKENCTVLVEELSECGNPMCIECDIEMVLASIEVLK